MESNRRYEVISRGPTVVSTHHGPREAAEAAKAASLTQETPVEVVDRQIERIIFRARGGAWRWITR